MQKIHVFDNYQLQEEVTEFNFSTFKNSDFSKSDLSSFEFIDCTFNSCDFSMSIMENTVFTKVKFVNCKMLGTDFGKCSKYSFSVSFDNCILNYCIFLKNRLQKSLFKKCIIKEALFSETDLTSASFVECDLTDTVFEGNNLSESDFSTSENYRINPASNKIKKAKFSYPGVLGLLSHYNIIVEE